MGPPAVWWLTREHFPVPVSGLFAVLFPPMTIGWRRAAEHYGWPLADARFAAVNGWLYYSGGSTDWEASLPLEPVAAHTLDAATWREEGAVARPRTSTGSHQEPRVAARGPGRDGRRSRSPATSLACVAHFAEVSPIHFEHSGFDIASGLLFRATSEWDIDPADVAPLLAGASPATAAVAAHLDEIVQQLDAVPDSLDDVRAAGDEAARGARQLLPRARVASDRRQRPRGPDARRTSGARSRDHPRTNARAGRRRWRRRELGARSRAKNERARFDELLADARGVVRGS